MNFCVTTRRGAAQCTRRWAHSKTKAAKPRFGSKPKPKAPAPATSYKPPIPDHPSQAHPRPPPPPPPPPRSHPQQADTLLTVWRATWLPLSGAALVAGALGFYIFGTAAATFKAGAAPCACDEDATPTGRPPALTGDNAEQFDKELDWPEYWMGITSLRRRLAAHARGNVLELAMGSGRNLAHYDWSPITNALEAAAAAQDNDDDDEAKKKKKKKTTTTTTARAAVNVKGITSFTGLDISADMLDVACKKLTKTVPPLKDAAPIVRAASSLAGSDSAGQLSFLSGRLRLVRSDAHHALPPPPAPEKGGASPKYYDTVIQTFGLCSVADPVAVLANLASAVKPDTGRIVLLEHGRGFFGLVNGLLDRNAGKHFAKYGCWWNRDIEALVEEAARTTPGLRIVKVERPKVLQMGTLVWVELKVEENVGKGE
ncbi:ubiquinone/menaquinone biosynthesis-related protein [Beauveria brongniartii RCEF 3172]|uniref:Ubiquinone/menaquinone biosynthesis-related protein n=1 Tax=Beauveria brongniartii RCEF 3172 TaxID=1081107 RepID=A0A167DH60_9HYPO|nr:ubiquinone/menaquinone biosynthesis-related protein [Beauveria brongniartii RCEF 3172]